MSMHTVKSSWPKSSVAGIADATTTLAVSFSLLGKGHERVVHLTVV